MLLLGLTAIFRDFLSIDKFLPLFDLFVKEAVKADVAKQILETFARTQTEPTDNALALSSLLYVAKVGAMMLIMKYSSTSILIAI